MTLALLCLLRMLEPAFSFGGVAQDNWKPDHLERLSPGLRTIVRKWESVCGGSIAAAQQFALYLSIPGGELVALHFDDFRCGTRSVLCKSNGCLHEVYYSMKGRYRRVLSVHARDVRLFHDNDAACIEISGVNGETKVLRWSGRQFVERQ
ncbi:hypothetical protein [Tardiphaga sp.]|uniref:hypothetical protein n=1 Tax=Tardiphaga sp. TaxID=1926292 RepID=UPI00352B8688